MTRLSQEHKDSIAVLIRDYNSLPWYAKWFFPAQLETALTAYQTTTNEVDSAWSIGNIFFKHTWFFQRWFLSCLDTFSQSALISSCSLSLSAYETEAHHPRFNASIDPEEAAANSRVQMERRTMRHVLTDPLEQAYYHAAENHPNIGSIRVGIYELHAADLLVGEAGKANFDTILVEQEFIPSIIARCLIALNDAGLLSGDNAQTNRDIIKRRSSLGREYLGDVVNALRELKNAGLFSGETSESKAIAQANFDAVIRHKKAPWAVARSLIKLSRAGLLTQDEGQEIRDIVSRHSDPKVVAHAILCLHESDSTRGQSSFMIYAQRKIPTFFPPQPIAQVDDELELQQEKSNHSGMGATQL